MALDNTSPQRFNQGVAGSAAFDLLLPTWQAEIIAAYEQSTLFEGLVSNRVIDSGVESRFPVTGRVDVVESWEAGVALEGGGGPTADVIVKLDGRPMASHVELDAIDEMVQQFDYRSAMLSEMGRKLASTRDQRLARAVAKAAGATATQLDASGIDPAYAGRSITDAGFATADSAAALKVLQAIEDEVATRMGLDIDPSGMKCVIRPDMFMEIRRLGVADSGTTGLDNPLFGGVAVQGGMGGSLAGAVSMRSSLTYMGCEILPSNSLIKKDFVTSTPGAGEADAGDANYAVDMSAVEGLIFQADAVASIRRADLQVRSEDDVRRNSTLLVASHFAGAGTVRPELACKLTSA